MVLPDEAPNDAEQQQGEDGVAGPEMKLHPVAAGPAAEIGHGHQDHERPMEQPHRGVPDADPAYVRFRHDVLSNGQRELAMPDVPTTSAPAHAVVKEV